MSGQRILQRLVKMGKPEIAIARLSDQTLAEIYRVARSTEPETDAARRVHGLCIIEAGDRFTGWSGGRK